MALLFNEGCENFEGDSATCRMNICSIKQNKFEKSLCLLEDELVKVYRSLNNVSNDISRNIFKYESYGPYRHSRIIILSDNNQDGIVFLYEYNIYNRYYPTKTYLCRLRNINQTAALCESLDIYYLGKRLSFNSYDVISEKNDLPLKHLKNPNHKIVKLKYKDLFIKEHSCHHIKTRYISHHSCMYAICEKKKEEYMLCSDANYSGKLIYLFSYWPEKSKKFIYLPEGCLKRDSNLACISYFCETNAKDKFFPCEHKEISAIKDIMPDAERSEVMPIKQQIVHHEDNVSASALFAMTLMPFLILFVFFWCYIYKNFKKRRRRKIY
ncbi:fam-e protein [Plasmodium gallinaceum]|uniref:Fam-e protein n=1 Tax=Plasmodium gallinaceum TaxID=5849 RepID=A0A1J1GXL6_PLAGA|nr:fam-e protein [Plasmodium gallinaceum]CRG96029.1 fam-e protein [Plasmodium gallinaceum]